MITYGYLLCDFLKEEWAYHSVVSLSHSTGKTKLVKQFCKSELRSRTRTRSTVVADFIHKTVKVDKKEINLQVK